MFTAITLVIEVMFAITIVRAIHVNLRNLRIYHNRIAMPSVGTGLNEETTLK